MKRFLAFILATLICFSLVACGESNSKNAPTNTETAVNDKNDTENYLGVWENEYFRLTITKGGVGVYENLMNDTEKYDFEWEVTDEVVVIRISGYAGIEHKAVLELNEDMSTLVALQNEFPAYVEGEDTFTKQQ